MEDTQGNRRRQRNRRHVLTILFLWAFLFMLDPSTDGSADGKGANTKKKNRVKVVSGNDASKYDSSSPGGSIDETAGNGEGENGYINKKELNNIFRDFILKPVGDNGASQILYAATKTDGLDSMEMYPKNISVNIRGSWRKTIKRAALPIDNVTVIVQLQEHSIARDMKHTLSKNKGNFTMYLRAKPSLSPLISNVEGNLNIYNGLFDGAMQKDIIRMAVRGLYLRRTGRLTLFSNAVSPHFGIHYGPKPIVQNLTASGENRPLKNTSNVHSSKSSLSSAGRLLKQSIDTKKSNLRPVPTGKNLCFFRMDFDVRRRNDTSLKSIKKYGGRNAGEVIAIDGFSKAPFNCDNMMLELSGSGVEFKLDATYSKANAYSVFYCIVVAWQWFLCVKQMEHIGTSSNALRMSVTSVGIQAVLDAVVCLSHMFVSLTSDAIFQSFSLVAFLKLVVFSIFELRIVLMIWKARRPAIFNDGFVMMRRELGKIYSRFYCSVIMGVALVYHMWDFTVVLLLLVYSFWIPQIFVNAYFDSRKSLSNHYMYGMSVSRLFLPLYYYGCPNSFIVPLNRWEPKPYAALLLVLWMALQLCALRAQELYGARIFIPKQFLPTKYDYRRSISVSDHAESLENSLHAEEDLTCSICLNTVNVREGKYFVTPCDHFFHEECLEEWMNVKHECPVCRTQLPPL